MRGFFLAEVSRTIVVVPLLVVDSAIMGAPSLGAGWFVLVMVLMGLVDRRHKVVRIALKLYMIFNITLLSPPQSSSDLSGAIRVDLVLLQILLVNLGILGLVRLVLVLVLVLRVSLVGDLMGLRNLVVGKVYLVRTTHLYNYNSRT